MRDAEMRALQHAADAGDDSAAVRLDAERERKGLNTVEAAEAERDRASAALTTATKRVQALCATCQGRERYYGYVQTPFYGGNDWSECPHDDAWRERLTELLAAHKIAEKRADRWKAAFEVRDGRLVTYTNTKARAKWHDPLSGEPKKVSVGTSGIVSKTGVTSFGARGGRGSRKTRSKWATVVCGRDSFTTGVANLTVCDPWRYWREWGPEGFEAAAEAQWEAKTEAANK